MARLKTASLPTTCTGVISPQRRKPPLRLTYCPCWKPKTKNGRYIVISFTFALTPLYYSCNIFLMENVNANPVKQLREQAGLSRPDCAVRAKIALNTLHSYESGYVSHIGPISALNLGRVLGCSASDLQTQYTQWRQSLAEERYDPNTAD